MFMIGTDNYFVILTVRTVPDLVYSGMAINAMCRIDCLGGIERERPPPPKKSVEIYFFRKVILWVFGQFFISMTK